MSTRELTLRVVVAAPVDAVWSAVTDWSTQSDWMLGTEVWVTGGDGASVGSRLAAFTGLAGVGFLDTMEIVEWQPPHRCVVAHTGRLVRGTGVIEVAERGEHASTVSWSERLDLPLGRFGAAGWRVLRPALAAGVRRSLDRFARRVGGSVRVAGGSDE